MSGNRYASALARGRRQYEEIVEEDAELLKIFGLRLLSVEGGGIRAAVESEIRGTKVNPWNVIEVNMKAWNWVRPLLVRLSTYGTGLSDVRDVLLRSDRMSDSDHERSEAESSPKSTAFGVIVSVSDECTDTTPDVGMFDEPDDE